MIRERVTAALRAPCPGGGGTPPPGLNELIELAGCCLAVAARDPERASLAAAVSALLSLAAFSGCSFRASLESVLLCEARRSDGCTAEGASGAGTLALVGEITKLLCLHGEGYQLVMLKFFGKAAAQLAAAATLRARDAAEQAAPGRSSPPPRLCEQDSSRASAALSAALRCGCADRVPSAFTALERVLPFLALGGGDELKALHGALALVAAGPSPVPASYAAVFHEKVLAALQALARAVPASALQTPSACEPEGGLRSLPIPAALSSSSLAAAPVPAPRPTPHAAAALGTLNSPSVLWAPHPPLLRPARRPLRTKRPAPAQRRRARRPVAVHAAPPRRGGLASAVTGRCAQRWHARCCCGPTPSRCRRWGRRATGLALSLAA